MVEDWPDTPQRSAILRRKHVELLNTAEAIGAQPQPKADELVFSARELVQATLPHRNPRGNPPVWSRTNGNYSLIVQPGYSHDPKTGEMHCIGYPYGVIPRLVLFWITTETLRTRSRRLYLGPSLTKFMTAIGLNPENGGAGAKRSDARRLKDQMERLFQASITFRYTDEEQNAFAKMHVAEKGVLWWNPRHPDQGNLFESYIDLGGSFYEAVLANPVPADLRALRALKNSPLALDLYTWLAYRAHRVTRAGKAVRVSWQQLMQQLGADFADFRSFKKEFKTAFAKVKALYPQLQVEQVRGGIQITPSSNTLGCV